MQPYNNFRYYFPPRPEIKSPQNRLPIYEKMGFWGSPKLNGSCSMLYTNSSLYTDSAHMKFMGRHQNTFAHEIIPKEDLVALHKSSGWQVLVGEYMNKSKKDANGKIFNGYLVLFDILVYNSKYLTGTTYQERQELLETLFPSFKYDKWIDQVSKNVYKVKNFKSGFVALYNEIIEIDMYEGLVFKRPQGILEMGLREINNTGWQVKIRKPTKNYTY